VRDIGQLVEILAQRVLGDVVGQVGLL